MKDTHLCFAFIHDPGALFGKKKVLVPEDLKGLKVRPAQSTIGEMVKMFGGTNVETTPFKGEPDRETLTEPPAGYQTPSPNYAYGSGPMKPLNGVYDPASGKYGDQ